ncbi:unnamed protein product [Trichobilharzia regenti]|nr:unnamed protein product [Trichobilharzia regenti]
MSGMPTSTELSSGSVHCERELELKADAVAEGMDTREILSVNDQRVAHLTADIKVELQLIIKDSSGDNPTVRQSSKGPTTTASDAPLSSSTCIAQSSSVLSSTMKGTFMNTRVLCYDYASISPLERTNVNDQFSEDNPTVYESVIVELSCTNKDLSTKLCTLIQQQSSKLSWNHGEQEDVRARRRRALSSLSSPVTEEMNNGSVSASCILAGSLFRMTENLFKKTLCRM